MPGILVGLFLAAHGIVHPILAYIPSRGDNPVGGGLWTKSWLLGEGAAVKRLIWISSTITAMLFSLAALGYLGWIIPQAWWAPLLVAACAASLLTLLVFWFREFFLGIAIDLALLALLLFANWTPAG